MLQNSCTFEHLIDVIYFEALPSKNKAWAKVSLAAINSFLL